MMNILKKLGIKRRSLYLYLIKSKQFQESIIGWYIWKFYIWPTYSGMLEALIEFVQHAEFRYKIQGGFGTYGPLYTRSKNLTEKATGKTWDEIKELLK